MYRSTDDRRRRRFKNLGLCAGLLVVFCVFHEKMEWAWVGIVISALGFSLALGQLILHARDDN